ncbi:MAG: AAA family ATPase [bacterium]
MVDFVDKPAENQDLDLIEKLRTGSQSITGELRKIIVGQDEVIDQVLIALFTGGHCLITGVPGLAKTLLIKTISQILDLKFKRIQFTPDLMPADITGTEIIEEERSTGRRELTFVKGPVFSNIILADEINRTPPKTQAALLEAMQEHKVTAGGTTYNLEEPFFVLATQNPIELEGTYPLPEAQLDRFMFNVVMDYLPEEQEVQVVTSTTSDYVPQFQRVVTGQDVVQFQNVVRKVPLSQQVAEYAVRLVSASRPSNKTAPDFVKNWVSWGAGLRASQYLILGGKARAILQGRYNVSVKDIQHLAMPVLRHRIITNFYAESEKISSVDIVKRLLETVAEPKSGL